jgi:hypothetical protein
MRSDGHALRYGGERGAPGAHAVVDDLPHDHRQHRVQGPGSRHSRSRHRRASRRPAELPGPRDQSENLRALHRQLRAPGGRLEAKRAEDGVSATVWINDGDTHNSPNEQAEVKPGPGGSRAAATAPTTRCRSGSATTRLAWALVTASASRMRASGRSLVAHGRRRRNPQRFSHSSDCSRSFNARPAAPVSMKSCTSIGLVGFQTMAGSSPQRALDDPAELARYDDVAHQLARLGEIRAAQRVAVGEPG